MVATQGTRKRLCPMDIQFIIWALEISPRQQDHFLSLLVDPETIDQILDDPRLLDKILGEPRNLYLSPELYFYLLLRRAFQDAGHQNPDLPEYAAGVLAEYSRKNPLRKPFEEIDSDLSYTVEIFAAMDTADAYRRFTLYIFAGNQFLFLTGLFSDYLNARTNRKGAPDIQYYEEFGKSSYQAAGEHPLAQEFDVKNMCHSLAVNFTLTRQVLQDVSDRLMFLD
ncbi:MAG TPA: hypothetical protein EYG38_02385 [Verrucomicrobia bacterium]|nr:hypothetical protein [Verrucomicrobiota bacterium]